MRVGDPVRVAVHGRPGVGRTTVAAALAGAGVCAVTDNPEVDVLVIADALKPEERTMLAASGATERPALVVLNKADLTGVAAGGPMAIAHRRADDCRATAGVPTVPLIGLLAAVELDDELVAALQTLVNEPADLSSTDAFARSDHLLAPKVRLRLLDAMDRFGIAHAVLALSAGADTATLPALLRRLSNLDRVIAALEAAGAAVRYRRICSAITELRCRVIESGDQSLDEFLSADDTVIAVMAAAVDVVEAAGLTVDRGDDPAAHLQRAIRWRSYSRGPVDALHRTCGADISRGSLRLLERARR